MSEILVIGATSAIAEHCARLWAARGDALYLVGRNKERLDRIAADLKIRGASSSELNCEDQEPFAVKARDFGIPGQTFI